jgi:hypothetical protein
MDAHLQHDVGPVKANAVVHAKIVTSMGICERSTSLEVT